MTLPDPGTGGDRRGSQQSIRAIRNAAPLLGAGAQMAAAVVLMFFGGRWADEKLGTAPWLMITGILFGMGAGLYTFIRTVSGVSKEEQAGNKE